MPQFDLNQGSATGAAIYDTDISTSLRTVEAAGLGVLVYDCDAVNGTT
jgi:hypothetical protein